MAVLYLRSHDDRRPVVPSCRAAVLAGNPFPGRWPAAATPHATFGPVTLGSAEAEAEGAKVANECEVLPPGTLSAQKADTKTDTNRAGLSYIRAEVSTLDFSMKSGIFRPSGRGRKTNPDHRLQQDSRFTGFHRNPVRRKHYLSGSLSVFLQLMTWMERQEANIPLGSGRNRSQRTPREVLPYLRSKGPTA